MIRAATILAFCAPAYAATLPAIQIEECAPGHIASGPVLVRGEAENWRGHVETVCIWERPNSPPNPFAYDALADLKGWHEEFTAPPPMLAGMPVPAYQTTQSHGAATGGARYPELAPSFYSNPGWEGWHHWRGGSWVSAAPPLVPAEPAPSQVPLPAGLSLYAALMAALGALTTTGRKKWTITT